jgi:glycosyltransferase involved in cell wall biosynthesis
LPEVFGEAALMVDPMSVEDIASAMIRIHKNEELKSELIEKGFKQQAIFSWDKSAVEMWKTIIKTLG